MMIRRLERYDAAHHSRLTLLSLESTGSQTACQSHSNEKRLPSFCSDALVHSKEAPSSPEISISYLVRPGEGGSMALASHYFYTIGHMLMHVSNSSRLWPQSHLVRLGEGRSTAAVAAAGTAPAG